MSHLAGQRNRSKETYPQARRAAGARVGFDQPIGKSAPIPTSGPNQVLPRDVAGAPLQVVIPNVSPGSSLEVDYKIAGVGADPGSLLRVIPVVRFAGAAAFAPGAGWFLMVNGQGTAEVGPGDVTIGAVAFGTVSVVVPPGAQNATVQLWYEAILAGLATFVMPGVEAVSFGNPGSFLKASEHSASSVVQAGPGALVAY